MQSGQLCGELIAELRINDRSDVELNGDRQDISQGKTATAVRGSMAFPTLFVTAISVIGFPLLGWAFVVVSELSWLREQVRDVAREYFASGCPDMQSIQQNIAVAENAGYRVMTTYTLPNDTWVTGYYNQLEPRAQALLDHPDASVRDFAAETVQEIAIFHSSEDSYGYVFYVLPRALRF